MSEIKRFKKELSELRNKVYNIVQIILNGSYNHRKEGDYNLAYDELVVKPIIESMEFKVTGSSDLERSKNIHKHSFEETYRAYKLNKFSTGLVCIDRMIIDTETISIEDIMLKLFLSPEILETRLPGRMFFQKTSMIATEELYEYLHSLGFEKSKNKTIYDFKLGYLCKIL